MATYHNKGRANRVKSMLGRSQVSQGEGLCRRRFSLSHEARPKINAGAEPSVPGRGSVPAPLQSVPRSSSKIPDACIGLGIKCMTPFEMLRRERARFVLGPQV